MQVQNPKVENEIRKENTKREIDNDIDEFKRRVPRHKASKKSSGSFLSKVPTWIMAMGLGLLALAALSFFISTLVVYFYGKQPSIRPIFPSSSAPGSPCSSTSDCILNSYCSKTSGSNVGTCTCSSNYYYDSSSPTQCTIKISTYNTTACTSSTQCMDSVGLICTTMTGQSTLVCACDLSIQYWSTTARECQYFKAVNTPCSSSSECNTIYSSCSGGYCQCNGNYYFNQTSGSCTLRSFHGAACSSNAYCINNAYCGIVSGDTVSKCWCDPLLYFYSPNSCQGRGTSTSSTCTATIDRCNIQINNLRCNTSSLTCSCDSVLEYWDTNFAQCLTLPIYSQTCNPTATAATRCIATANMVCLTPAYGGSRSVCKCSSNYYYDVISASCVLLKIFNATCNNNFECANFATTQCATYGLGSVTKRCICIPNYSYYNGSQCVVKKAYNSSCATQQSYECQDYSGLVCASSSGSYLCECPSTQFYNSTSKACQFLARKFDFCINNIQCSSGSCNTVSLSCN